MNLTVGSFVKNLAGGEEAVEAPGVIPGGENPTMNSVIVRALKGNTETVFIGGKGVTEATGFPLEPGDSVSVDIQGLGKLFAIPKKAGDKLAVLWVGP